MGSPRIAEKRVPVTHLVLSLETGGLETVVLNLARHADRDRFSHRVICLRHPGTLAPLVEAEGAPVTALHRTGRIATLRALLSQLRLDRPQILHTHNPLPHQFGAIARTLGRASFLVHTKHGRNFPDDPVAVWVNRQCSRATDVVVAVSEDAAEVARSIERVPEHKLRVVLNGIETDRFKPVVRATRGQPRAICIARLDPVKDIPGLLEAVVRVRPTFPWFRLDIVGEGPDRNRIEQARSRLELDDVVALRGHRTDVPALLEDADLFLLASISEGVSLTLLEAMAAGLPIVATAVGGNREVVVEGETGFLVPSRDPAALAAAIARLLSSPELRARMGAAARVRVEHLFDARVMASRYEDLYTGLLADGHRIAPRRAQPL